MHFPMRMEDLLLRRLFKYLWKSGHRACQLFNESFTMIPTHDSVLTSSPGRRIAPTSRLRALLCVLFVGILAGLAPAYATTHSVTLTSDVDMEGSLRHEIENAAPGDTISIKVPGPVEVTRGCISVTTNLFIVSGTTSQVTLSGLSLHQLFCVSNANVTFKNLHFTDTWSTAGGVIRATDANIEMINCAAFDNRATEGSVIYADYGSITVRGCSFYDNESHGTGAVLNIYEGLVSAENSTFANNRAGGCGAGIYVFGTATVANCNFVTNHATLCGAAIFLDGDFMTVEHSRFDGNHVDEEGGAIFAYGGLSITSSTFVNNQSTRSGAGVRFDGELLDVSHSTFANNSTVRNGGGLRISGDAIVTSSTFINNYSTRSGAGIAHFNGGLFLHSTLFEDNVASTGGGACLVPDFTLVTSCTFRNNTAAIIGGALFQEGEEDFLWLEDSYFYGNNAYYDGGAVFAFSSEIISTNSSFRNNHANFGDGGGVFIDFGYAESYDCTFANNTAWVRGGAYYTYEESEMYFFNCRLDSNFADVSGGAVYAQDFGYLVMVNSSFMYNRATDNGGAYRQQGGAHQWTENCTFAWNTAGISGGAAKISGDELMVTSCTFRNNTAANNGGGVRISGSGINFIGCTFANNQAEDGGAAWGFLSGMFFYECNLSGNIATNHGGAVAVNSYPPDDDDDEEFEGPPELPELPEVVLEPLGFTLAYLESCTVTNNHAAIDGGALHAFAGDIETYLCNVSYNTSTQNGAAVAGDRFSYFFLDQSTFANNAAGMDGGVVFADGVYAGFVDYCDLLNNTAGRNGGGIYSTGAVISIGWSTIANCTAAVHGGGILSHSRSTTNVTSCTISENTAGEDGGGILTQASELIATGNTFVLNVAGHFGGAIHNESAIKAHDNTFSQNSAAGHGGAIYSSKPLFLTSNTITLNVADNDDDGGGHGGGIYGPGGSIRSNIIAGNTDRGGEYPDVGGAFSSDGYNLIGTVGDLDFSSNTTGDRYGDPNGTTTKNAGAKESATTIDAGLQTLADNGGHTFTHALDLSSPAINHGAPTGVAPLDQRERLAYGIRDIGSFEALPPLEILGATTACVGVGSIYSLRFFSTEHSYSWFFQDGSDPGFELNATSTSGAVGWNLETIATVTVVEDFPDGSSRATTLVVSTFPVLGQMDYVCVTAGSTVTFNVLNNDIAAGLTVTGLNNEEMLSGTASWISSGVITYTAPADFTGFETFSYTAQGESLCTGITVNVVIAVKPTEESQPNLSYVQRKQDRSGGVRGLKRVADVALTSDGRYVFGAGWSDHSVAMFERNVSTGTLTYLGRARHLRRGVSNMRYPSALALSPDESVLYVTSYADNSLLVFNIDYDNGELDLYNILSGDGGPDPLQNPVGVAASSDGRSVYVASFNNHSLAHFETQSSAANISFVGLYQDGQEGIDGLRNAMGVAVSPDGKNVYVAGNGDDAVAVFRRSLNDGTLSWETQYRDGINGVDGLASPTSVALSPDSKSVYVTGLGDKALAVFKRNPQTCTMTFTEKIKDGQNGVDGLYGAYDVQCSDDGRSVYVVGELDNAIALFRRSLADCSLTYVQCLKDGQGGVDGLRRVRALDVSNDSRHVYCAGRNDNAISVFARNLAPEAVNDNGGGVAPSSNKTISVLSNDSDPENDALTVTAKTDGTLGTVAITGGGTTVEYSAGAASGVDSFTYTIEDGNGGSSTATVTITVAAVKQGDEPVAIVESEIRVSPHPVGQFADVVIETGSDAPLDIRLLDMSGRAVCAFSLPAAYTGAHQFSIEGREVNGVKLAAGVYVMFVEYVDGDGVAQQLRRSIVIAP